MPSVDLDGVTIAAAARAPLSCLHMTLRCLDGGGDGGAGGGSSGSRFAQRLRRSLTPEMGRALSTMLTAPTQSVRSRMVFPSVMTPVLAASTGWGDEAADAIADTSSDDLLAGLAYMSQEQLADRWQEVEKRPRKWLHEVAEAMRVANAAYSEVWNASTARREIELHLLDQLLVAGAAPHAISELAPTMKVESRKLIIGHNDGLVVAPQSRLELVPMITWPGGYLLSSGENRVQVGYSVRGVLAQTRAAQDVSDPLTVLLGNVRSAMLRHLGRPRTMSDLASAVGRAPSTVSVHARLMIDAGLAERVELGNKVWLVRTKRGTRFLELFGDDGVL